MNMKIYTDVHEFSKNTHEVLMRHEAQNLIPLGNIIIGCEGKDKTDWRDPVNWFMAVVADGDGIRLTAIMTPPHNLALYATNNEINTAAVNCLINSLGNRIIPGVMTEKTLAETFAKAYTSLKGMNYVTTFDQRIFELTEVNPDIPQLGTLRLVCENDMPFFPYWYEGFKVCTQTNKDETVMSVPQDGERYRHHISTKQLYILEVDGVPVSMARLNRAMRTVIGIGAVYTPPYYRGKGYASSCVAQLSQIALNKGFTKCVLYTDLANPTSNSIYQKIGYRPISDSLMLKFFKRDRKESRSN